MENQEGEKKDVRRPMNAFLIFCKRHRSMVREKNPDLDNRSVTKILGDLWANLANEKKSVYTTLAKQYKDAFMKANPDYKWHNPDKIHQPPVKMATRPTNARVIKNEVGINLDGSIVPGKLADPSKMGGLSLLLMAGQQNLPAKQDPIVQERKDTTLATTPTEENATTSKSALLELAEMCTNELNFEPDQEDDKTDVFKKTEQKLTTVKVKGDENVKVTQLTEEETEPMDLSTKTGKNSLQEKVTLSKPVFKQEVDSVDSRNEGDMSCKPSVKDEGEDVKRGISQEKLSDQQQNEMINCGKVVVDHIFDRLMSAQIECQLNSKPFDDKTPRSRPVDKVSRSREEEVGESHIDRVVTEIYNQTETEPVETCILKTLQEDQEGQSSGEGHLHDDSDEREGGGKRGIAEYDGQNEEDMIPVRKSRRRNRGQRYQELINEGIIQPSKERLAARRAAKTLPDDDSDSYEDYTMVEEVVEKRPTRKRMISEGEDGEDLKKYKTGDFDLEAHIADLPACSLDQLSKGGKKNLLRARHLSESSIKKSTTSLTALKEEVTSCLPPHVRLKSTELSSEQVVGSRRRKVRKHSITHLIPAQSVKNIPPTDALNNQTESTKPDDKVMGERSEVKGESKVGGHEGSEGEERVKGEDTESGREESVETDPSLQQQEAVFYDPAPTTGSSSKVKDTDGMTPDDMDAKTKTNATKLCELSRDVLSEGQKLVRSFSEPSNAMTSHLVSTATTDRHDLPATVTTSNNTDTTSLDNQDKASSESTSDNAIKTDQPKSSQLNTEELAPFHSSPVEKVNMSASAVRVDIITAEVKPDDGNPSMQCPASSPVTVVHS